MVNSIILQELLDIQNTISNYEQKLTEIKDDPRYTDKIRQKLNKYNKDLEILDKLVKRYPDLDKYYFNKYSVYNSSLVNSLVNRVCIDRRYTNNNLYIWPYLNVEETRIYSCPSYFCIGKYKGDRQILDNGWKDKLYKANISGKIIEIICTNGSK